MNGTAHKYYTLNTTSPCLVLKKANTPSSSANGKFETPDDGHSIIQNGIGQTTNASKKQVPNRKETEMQVYTEAKLEHLSQIDSSGTQAPHLKDLIYTN